MWALERRLTGLHVMSVVIIILGGILALNVAVLVMAFLILAANRIAEPQRRRRRTGAHFN